MAALLVGLGLRILVLVTYQPAGLFSSDSYLYLADAGHLAVPGKHPFGYPAFLSVLRPFENLMVVPLVQHIMGLAVAVLIYALLRRLGAGAVAATIGALPWLLDGLVLNLEQYVMAETLFTALVIVALAALAWNDRLSVRTAVLTGLLLALASLTRTPGLVLILPALGYVLLRRLGRWQAGALATAFVLPILLYASVHQATHGVFGLTRIEGLVLYGRVAPFADCSGLQLTPYEWQLCDLRPPEERPGPNYYVSRNGSPLNLNEPPPGVTRNAAGRAFFFRIVGHQPGAYLRTVFGDLAHYAEPTRTTGPRDYSYGVWKFQDSYANLDKREAAVARYGGTLRILSGPADFLRTYGRFAVTVGPVLVLALVLALLGGIFPPKVESGRRLRAGCFLLAACGLGLLLVPAATAVFDYRFLFPALAVLPPAGALGASALAQRLRDRAASSTLRATQPGPV